MAIDFVLKKVPEYRLATRTLRGKWPGDKRLRAEFERLDAWAKQRGLRTGKWFFREFGEEMGANAEWEVGIEVRGPSNTRGTEGVAMKRLPSSTVAALAFDPDLVSPRVIYHGMADWLRSRKKAGEYREAGAYREVYQGNPWVSKRAWANTQVQVPVRRIKG